MGVGEKGSPAVAVPDGEGGVILVAELMQDRLDDSALVGEKLIEVDEHVWMAVSGLRADGRVLADRARQECQEYRLSYGEAPTVRHVAAFVADVQHGFTRTGGARPFGVTCLVVGLDPRPRAFPPVDVIYSASAGGENLLCAAGNGVADESTRCLPATVARVFRTDPSGSLTEWSRGGVAVGKRAERALAVLVEEVDERTSTSSRRRAEAGAVQVAGEEQKKNATAATGATTQTGDDDRQEKEGEDRENEDGQRRPRSGVDAARRAALRALGAAAREARPHLPDEVWGTPVRNGRDDTGDLRDDDEEDDVSDGRSRKGVALDRSREGHQKMADLVHLRPARATEPASSSSFSPPPTGGGAPSTQAGLGTRLLPSNRLPAWRGPTAKAQAGTSSHCTSTRLRVLFYPQSGEMLQS